MDISLIAAMDRNRGIGFKGKTPWRLSADLRFFKEVTTRHAVVMGRLTREVVKSALPGRDVIVLTGNENYVSKWKDDYIAHSREEAMRIADRLVENELFIAGGSMVYHTFIDYANCMYLTLLEAEFECDAFFPVYDRQMWLTVEEHNLEEGGLKFKIVKLVRKELEGIISTDDAFLFYAYFC